MHGWTLHSCVCRSRPEHCFPPLVGAGLVQVLVLSRSPVPHNFEQAVQSVQSLHWPSTMKIFTYLSKKANLVTEMSMQRCPLPIFCWWSDATEALIYKITALLSLKEKKNTPNVWEKPKSVTILTKKTFLTPLHPSTIFRYFFLIL